MTCLPGLRLASLLDFLLETRPGVRPVVHPALQLVVHLDRQLVFHLSPQLVLHPGLLLVIHLGFLLVVLPLADPQLEVRWGFHLMILLGSRPAGHLDFQLGPLPDSQLVVRLQVGYQLALQLLLQLALQLVFRPGFQQEFLLDYQPLAGLLRFQLVFLPGRQQKVHLDSQQEGLPDSRPVPLLGCQLGVHQ